jgi:hypothetical protein
MRAGRRCDRHVGEHARVAHVVDAKPVLQFDDEARRLAARMRFVLAVAGFFHTMTDERSAVTLMPGTGGTVPRLLKRGTTALGGMPSSATVWFISPSAYTDTWLSRVIVGAAAKWSKWPCVTSSTSTLPRASRVLVPRRVGEFSVCHGTVTTTVPHGVLMRTAIRRARALRSCRRRAFVRGNRCRLCHG